MPPASMNQQAAERAAARLGAAGFPLGPLHEPVRLWRSHSGKKLHAKTGSCPRNEAIRPSLAIWVDFFTQGYRFCACVELALDTEAGNFLRVASLARDAEELCTELDQAAIAPTVHQLGQLREVRELLEDARPYPPLIAQRTSAAAAAVEAALASDAFVALSEQERALHTARAARELTCRSTGSPPRVRLPDPEVREEDEVFFTSGTWGYEASKVFAAVWDAWSRACDGLAGPEVARAAAITAGQRAAGGGLERFSQLPTTLRFAAADFPSPRAWAEAEWRAAMPEQLSSLVRFWEAQVRDRLEAGSDLHTIGVCNLTTKAFSGEVIAVMSAFDHIVSDGTWVLCAPRVIAEWLERRVSRGAYTYAGAAVAEVTDYGLVQPDCGPGYLEVVECLWREDTCLEDAISLAVLSVPAA